MEHIGGPLEQISDTPPDGVSASIWREYRKAREALTNGHGFTPPPPSGRGKRKPQERRKTQAGQSNGGPQGPTSSLLPQYTETSGREKKEERGEGENGAGNPVEPLPERGIPEPVKERMVELFAQFQSVTAVQKAVKAEFKLVLQQRTIETYNPASRLCRMGKRLRSLYDATRKAYVERSVDMGLAHQAHRLRVLGEIVEKATHANDFGNAIKGLELAAKEMGGALEGKTIVTHTGAVAHVHGSVEDMRQELAMRLATVVESMPLAPVLEAPEATATEGGHRGPTEAGHL